MDQLRSQLLSQLRSRPRLLAGGAALVVAMGAGGWFLFGSPSSPLASASPSPSPSPSASPSPTPSPTPRPTPSPTPEPPVACPFNGMPVDDDSVVERTPLAVQIENHPAARPTSNLTRADMVIEAPVEGDITRYTAIYLCRTTEGLVGPVRSGRYYLIDLWQDMHVLPYFFGSSSEAIKRYADAGMPFVNGISGGWPGFQRAGSNAAPHNLYSDIEAVRAAFGVHERLDAVAARLGELRPPFTFDPTGSVPPGRVVANLEIQTNSYWHFGWRWDSTIGAWRRTEAGVDHVDEATGEPITAVSVVVQRVVQEIVYDDPDPGGNTRRYQHLVGEGPATLYVGGQAIELRWSRPTAEDGTTWTYAVTGEPVVLPPGQVWWQIVPTTAGVTET